MIKLKNNILKAFLELKNTKKKEGYTVVEILCVIGVILLVFAAFMGATGANPKSIGTAIYTAVNNLITSITGKFTYGV